MLGNTVVHLPDSLLQTFCGGADRQNGQTLDARLQLGLLLARTQPAMEAGTPEQARMFSSTDAFNIEKIELPRVEDFSVSGPTGEAPVPIRLYAPVADDVPRPALVYSHGGGFVIGSLDSFDRALRFVCQVSGCIVVSVGYRLAPEHKFPAALEDCIAAYGAVHERAREFRIDPEHIGVGGDSAGGNLAVNLCLAARAGRVPMPRFQALIYPWLDGSQETESHRTYGTGYGLTRDTIRWFIENAMPTPDFVFNELASPLLADPEKFKGLPPVFIQLSGFDPLRDEGRRYFERMREWNVPARCQVYESLIHGILSMGGIVPEVRRLLDEYGRAVSELAG